MDERRFSEDEMAAIFRRATEDEATTRSSADARGLRLLDEGRGFTLAELQEIAAEAGIDAGAVAREAAALTAPEGGLLGPPIRTEARGPGLPGLPLAVAHTVELQRALTDDEWQDLVVLLRDTFEARGKAWGEGSFREWANGNLEVSLEPRGGGERLRMRSRKTGGEAMPIMGAALLGMAGLFTLLGLFGAKEWTKMAPLALSLGVGGGAVVAVGIAQVRRWAALRREQFEALAARVSSLAARALPAGRDEGADDDSP